MADGQDAHVVTDPDLHLIVDGARVEPAMRDGVAVFALSLPCGDVLLASRAGRPDELGLNADGRVLGYRLAALTLVRGEARQAVALDHPALGDGFHDVEATGMRWTMGLARLPAAVLAGEAGPVELHVEGFALPQYRAATPEEAALFARFESLGDNCEFGMVQREYRVEPFSLLRWAGTDAARLVLGLCRRFEGLGDPDATTIEWAGDPPDYKLRDRRYLTMHTWIGEQAADAARLEELRLTGAARLRLLRRKLLADIADGRRIFIFKQSPHLATREPLFAVHAALRGIGPAPLLCVVRAETPEQVGRVDALGDGLYIGHIDDFGRRVISFGAWRRICAATVALVDAAAS